MGPATGVGAYVWGGEAVGNYWGERYFLDRVLENYNGSVYLIQGMQDWNVDPHMAVPTINILKQHGIDAKGLFGQWDHDYPDRPDYHFDRSAEGRGREAYPQMTRFDWMQDLLEWFDYYLKGIGDKPGQWIEIQSNHGEWRIEDFYPPQGMLSTSAGSYPTSVAPRPSCPMPRRVRCTRPLPSRRVSGSRDCLGCTLTCGQRQSEGRSTP